MAADWLAALEASAPSAALRGSVWAYPLVNAAHLLGVALLVGGVVPLDARLLGAWRTVPADGLWRVLTRTAGAGLALAVGTGALLFSVKATAYARSPWFLVKMAVVAAGACNVLVIHRLAARRPPGQGGQLAPSPATRVSAGFSLAAWLAALALGRLVGYF
jgi:hypothetical protein